MTQTREDLERQLDRVRGNIDHPHNDGWTNQMYKDEANRLEEKLRKIGKQLKIPFNNI